VDESNDKENITKDEPIFMPKFKQMKRLSLNRLREIKADMCPQYKLYRISWFAS